MVKFAIVLGEPNSINSEILAKSIASKKRCIVIGNFRLLETQLKYLKIKKKIRKISNIEKANKYFKYLNILDVPLKFKNAFSVKSIDSELYIKKCFNLAHKLCVQKKIKGFINCAIDKKKLFKKNNTGVTEYLAKKNNVYKSEAMLIYNKKLSVVPLTTHIRIKDISKSLKKSLIQKKIRTINNYYFKYFKIRPRIGILGLNPHNLEFKKNSEEIKIILPAIKSLKKSVSISGPFSPDTVFLKKNLNKFDVIVGMYHDQVLTPFKTLFEFDAINITLGLPYIRISPDHGVASDKKKLNISTPKSLNNCLRVITNLTR
tara:strand:- start:3344 stop:4294 length:951 start_codon:yes stop_codon:yes gene_type:complete